MTYITSQLAKLNAKETKQFKLKVHSEHGETFWFTISPEALKEIEAILEKEYEIK